jgi:hypothetical protein
VIIAEILLERVPGFCYVHALLPVKLCECS